MLKFIAILFIIFGALYLIDYLPIMNENLDQAEYNNFSNWLEQNNYSFYVITDIVRRINKIIGMVPFLLGVIILCKYYHMSYFLAKIILISKIALFPLSGMMIYQRFVYESNLEYIKPIDLKAGIIAMFFTFMSMLIILIIYIIAVNLLKKKILKTSVK